jgi:hypothetical protein
MWVGSVMKLSVLAASDNPPIRLLSRGQEVLRLGDTSGMDILAHRYVADWSNPVPDGLASHI